MKLTAQQQRVVRAALLFAIHGDDDAWLHPPGKLVGIRSNERLGRRNPQLFQYFYRAFARRFAIKTEMHHCDFVDLTANLANRVKGGHRVLSYEGDATAA